MARLCSAVAVDTCHPKTIRVSVADTPKPKRGWKQVAELSTSRSVEPQMADFQTIQAKYVKLEVVENWGGPFVGLGEIEILAAGKLPYESSDERAEVWPNVSAMGYRPNIYWQFIAYVLLTAAEVMVSIVCLEFAYTQAPKTMKSFRLCVRRAMLEIMSISTDCVTRLVPFSLCRPFAFPFPLFVV